MSKAKEERTLILIKPDAIQRSLMGEILKRFEQKGLQLIGIKMMQLDKEILKGHYAKHVDKPFFESLAKSMSYSPIVAMVFSGLNAVTAARIIVGATKSYEADAGTIRGDLAISGQSNLVHASDPDEDPDSEIKRFFKDEEIFPHRKMDFHVLYGDEEKEAFEDVD
jgi:nucleoside-diphosphate kinase